MAKGSTRRKRRGRRRRLILLSLLGTLLVVLFIYRADFFFHWAEKSIARRDLVAARRHLGWARSLGGEKGEGHFLSARISRLQGRFDDMRESLGRAQEANYDAERIRREEWLAMAQLGKLEKAHVRVSDLLMDPRGDEREICEAYSMGFIIAHDFRAAKQILDGWRKDFPDDIRPRFLLGVIQKEEHLLVEAEKTFKEVLEIDPDHHDAAFQLGNLLLVRKRPSEALQYLQRGAVEGKNAVEARVARAKCLRLLGRRDEARQQLRAALKQQPGDQNAWLESARLDLDERDYPQIVKKLKDFVIQDPRRTEMRLVYAQALRGLGSDEEADKHFKAIAEKSKKLLEADALTGKLTLGRDSADLRQRIGAIYWKYSSDEEALYWFTGALNANPRHQPTLQSLAAFYDRLRQPQRAAQFRRQLDEVRKSTAQ